MKDIFGVQFNIGQYVVYTPRGGRSNHMKVGIIKKINKDSLGIMGGTYSDYGKRFIISGRISTNTSLDNMLVIPENIVPDFVRKQFGTLANLQASNG